MSKAEQIKAKRRAVRNRKRRKFRSKFYKSKKGMRASVRVKLPDGSVKVTRVRKRFYFQTYSAEGKSLGTFWFMSPRPNKELIKKYKETHGVKHPAALPIKKPDQISSMKKKAVKRHRRK